IAGESLAGCIAAVELVSWYNGHPDSVPDYRLDAESVAVVGAGNVALDIARMLVSPYETLAETDIPTGALSRFSDNATRTVYVVIRRGPEDTKFATKELRELAAVPDLRLEVDPPPTQWFDDPGVDRRTKGKPRVLRDCAT